MFEATPWMDLSLWVKPYWVWILEDETFSTVWIDPDNIDTVLALFHCHNALVCRREFLANGVTKFFITTECGRYTGELVILRAQIPHLFVAAAGIDNTASCSTDRMTA